MPLQRPTRENLKGLSGCVLLAETGCRLHGVGYLNESLNFLHSTLTKSREESSAKTISTRGTQLEDGANNINHLGEDVGGLRDRDVSDDN